ncbi:MAG: response regulator transcription factor [Dongiaceae bacterium]
MSVAIVDDDESVRRALQRLLHASDLVAETYASGREFLDSLRSRRHPDCLVLDLQMPGMNGLEVQRELANAGLHLPVVVITGHDEPGVGARCLSAGASAYLRKPFDDRAILDAIAAAVASPRPH